MNFGYERFIVKQSGGALKVNAMIPSILIAIGSLVVIALFLGTISCIVRPGTTYERFDEQLNSQISQTELTDKLKKVTVLLQNDELLLDEVADMTCSVYTQISRTLVQNAAAPTPETPTPIDQKALNARAQAQFEDTKQTYMKKNCNQPMLECFAEQDASAAEKELRAAVAALDTQLSASKMKMKAKKIKATLDFTAPYVQSTVAAFSEGFESDGCAVSENSAIAKATGTDLITKGVALYNEAMNVHTMIMKQPGAARLQRDALAAINAKKDALSNNPGEVDLDHYKKEGQDPKYSE
jgi:hypothetical protein